MAVPNKKLTVGDSVILFHHPDGDYAVEASVFDKLKSLSTDKSLTIEKLKLLIEVKA